MVVVVMTAVRGRSLGLPVSPCTGLSTPCTAVTLMCGRERWHQTQHGASMKKIFLAPPHQFTLPPDKSLARAIHDGVVLHGVRAGQCLPLPDVRFQ